MKREADHSLPITPLIDIVFQLLVFFVMTFKVVDQEGDFRILMPHASRAGVARDSSLPIIVSLIADNRLEGAGNAGGLAEIRLNDRSMGSFEALQQQLIQLADDDSEPPAAGSGSLQDTELELRCSPTLRYEFVVAGMTAVTGVQQRDGSITPLITNVRITLLPASSPNR